MCMCAQASTRHIWLLKQRTLAWQSSIVILELWWCEWAAGLRVPATDPTSRTLLFSETLTEQEQRPCRWSTVTDGLGTGGGGAQLCLLRWLTIRAVGTKCSHQLCHLSFELSVILPPDLKVAHYCSLVYRLWMIHFWETLNKTAPSLQPIPPPPPPPPPTNNRGGFGGYFFHSVCFLCSKRDKNKKTVRWSEWLRVLSINRQR